MSIPEEHGPCQTETQLEESKDNSTPNFPLGQTQLGGIVGGSHAFWAQVKAQKGGK